MLAFDNALAHFLGAIDICGQIQLRPNNPLQ